MNIMGKMRYTCMKTFRKTIPMCTVRTRTSTGISKKRVGGLLAVAAGFGSMIGVAYGIKGQPRLDGAEINFTKPKIIKNRPDVVISKRVSAKNQKYDLDFTIFQYQTCPFCCKVRTVMDFYGLPYSIVEVDAVLKQQLKWSDYKKVPILLVRTKDRNYLQLIDSSTIVSIIKSYVMDGNRGIGEIAEYYPRVTYIDENGQTSSDCPNKYFVMYQDAIKDKEETDEVM